MVWPRAKDGPRRLPRRILEWCPSGRRGKGRPRNSWMQEVTTVDAGGYNRNRERGIVDLEWVDREGRRKKINLPSAQKI